MRILIADDNALVREGIAEILGENAWEVCGQVSDGLQTLEQARALQPDLILLDVSMPGTNGLEVAAAIKSEMPTIKVVIVSQHDFSKLLPGAQRNLADGFIDKNRLGTELASTIAKILSEP
jgi:DNA-binding NarL/FixJ family response regulator